MTFAPRMYSPVTASRTRPLTVDWAKVDVELINRKRQNAKCVFIANAKVHSRNLRTALLKCKNSNFQISFFY